MENITTAYELFEIEDFIQGMFSIQKKINRMIEAEANLKTQFERLQQRYNEYKTIVDNIPLMISIKDMHSSYSFCNQLFLQHLNMINNYHGKTDFDLYPEEIAKTNVAEDKRVIENGRPETIVQKYILNEKEISLRKIKAPILNEKNQIRGIIEISKDIAGEELVEAFKENLNQQTMKSGELEASLNETIFYYEALLEEAPIGVWIFENNKIIFVNTKGAEILDYSKEEILFKHSTEMIAMENINSELTENDENNNDRRKYVNSIIPFIQKDGSTKLISGKKIVIQYRGQRQIAIYGRDCTDQKKIEHDLKNAFDLIQSIVNSMEPSN